MPFKLLDALDQQLETAHQRLQVVVLHGGHSFRSIVYGLAMMPVPGLGRPVPMVLARLPVLGYKVFILDIAPSGA